MRPDTSSGKFSQQTLRQVAADARRALARLGYCPDRSPVEHLRCVDAVDESETAYGRQLWFFESVGVDSAERRQRVFGGIEYSIQYGLSEPVEDGVFEDAGERDRFRDVYLHAAAPPRRRHWLPRWLAAGLLAVAAAYLCYHLVLAYGILPNQGI